MIWKSLCRPSFLPRFSHQTTLRCISHARICRSEREARDLSEITRLKAELEVGLRGRLSGIVPPKRCRDVTHRIGSKFSGSHSLRWIEKPRTILLVRKAYDEQASRAFKQAIQHLQTHYSHLQLVVEAEAFEKLDLAQRDQIFIYKDHDSSSLSRTIDLVVAVGGDGTVLHVASLFAKGAVPPILGVSMGSLGFLLPYTIEDFPSVFQQVFQDEGSLLLRMRLKCNIHDSNGAVVERFDDTDGSQALNEVALHRGRQTHLSTIETFVDGQYLTEAIADGLVISTPTGSTAYSLSAGGPIVHPSVPSLLLTPICPRSLSFRSVLLPSDACLQLRVSPQSRGPAEVSLDGRAVHLLHPSEYLSVSMSKYPVPCIVPGVKPISEEVPYPLLHLSNSGLANKEIITNTNGNNGSNGGDERKDEILDGGWVRDINQMLHFNAAFKHKHLS